jgi:hypothetical protein
MMKSDIVEKLLSEGWQQRFSASGERLDEAIRNYRELGFEVKTIPMKELQGEDCSVCFDNEIDNTMMLFTRKLSEGKHLQNNDYPGKD